MVVMYLRILIQADTYMDKLNDYIRSMVQDAKQGNNTAKLQNYYNQVAVFYKNKKTKKKKRRVLWLQTKNL